MPDRSRKPRSPDVNVIASSIVDALDKDKPRDKAPEKNPAAVALGRLGGLKGGNARAAKLSSKKRKAIAKKAALARWQKHEQ